MKPSEMTKPATQTLKSLGETSQRTLDKAKEILTKYTQSEKEQIVSKKQVTVKGTMNPQTVATILEDLLESFKKGQVVVQNGAQFVTLKPSDSIGIELEAAMKKGKEKLTLELSWQQKIEVEAPESDFSIGSEEPEIPEPVAEPAAESEEKPAEKAEAANPVIETAPSALTGKDSTDTAMAKEMTAKAATSAPAKPAAKKAPVKKPVAKPAVKK